MIMRHHYNHCKQCHFIVVVFCFSFVIDAHVSPSLFKPLHAAKLRIKRGKREYSRKLFDPNAFLGQVLAMFFNYKTFLIGRSVDLNHLGVDKRNRCIQFDIRRAIAYARATKVTSAIRLVLIHTMQSKWSSRRNNGQMLALS